MAREVASSSRAFVLEIDHLRMQRRKWQYSLRLPQFSRWFSARVPEADLGR